MRAEDMKLIVKKKFMRFLSETPGVKFIAGGLGVEFGERREYHEKAKIASQKSKQVQDTENNLLWIPVHYEEEVILVYALDKNSTDNREKIKLIRQSLNEISYNEYLKHKISETIDQKSLFIKDVLTTNKYKSIDQVIDRGDIIGLNLRSKQAVIVFEIPSFLENIKIKNLDKKPDKILGEINNQNTKLIDLLEGYFKLIDSNVFCFIAKDTFICLKGATGDVRTENTIDYFKKKAKYLKEAIEKETGITPTMGVGQYYPGLSGLKKSYYDALVSLDLGKKIWGAGKVYHILDLGTFVCLTHKLSFERKCEITYQVLGPVLEDEELYKTVKTFLSCNMNLSEASQKLHLHRNTLIYRLDKVKSMIGLDPRKFSHAVKINLGLLLYGPSIRCERA